MPQMTQGQPATLTTPVLREMAGAVLNAPVAGSTSIVRLPAGRTYQTVVLETTKAAGAIPLRAELEAAISGLRLVVSGQELWSVTGLQICAINQYYNVLDTSGDGRITFNFERLWMLAGMQIFEILGPAFGTLDQSSFDIEVDWSGGSLITAAKVYARIGQTPENSGKVIRLARVTANVAAIGVYQFPDLPMPKPGDYLAAIHIFTPVIANLTRVAYIPDEQRTIDLPPGLMNRLAQENHPVRTPQTAKNVFTLDFAMRGMGGDLVNLGSVGSHLLELTFANAAPGLVPIVCEIITDISNVKTGA